jgi:hypothetical protein
MWALSSFRRRKEGKTRTGLQPEFSLGGRGEGSESIRNLFDFKNYVTKIMLYA